MAELRTTVGWVAGLVLCAASPAAAQTIAPGMTTAQVRSLLGEPTTVRSTGDWSYLYYLNGCAVRCGSDDVVFVQNDRVVTAVFRTSRRRIAGGRADDALERTAGADVPGTIRLDESAAPPTQMRVRQRASDDEGARDEPGRTVTGRPGARPTARVGGVRVDAGGGATIIRRDDEGGSDARRGSDAPARAGSLDARRRVNDNRADDRGVITGTGVDSPEDDVAAVDSSRGAPATAVDDARRARENRVERNTVRITTPGTTSDSTLNGARRERERNVTPRAVTRP